MIRVLNLLTAGGVGGIEVLCKDIGKNSKLENAFCFMFGTGRIYDQMKECKMNIFDMSMHSKLSMTRLRELTVLAKKYEVIVVHHDDPFLEMYYLLLKCVFRNKKKFVSIVHHCFDPESDIKNYGLLKRVLKRVILNLTFRFSDKIIFVSKAGYESYLGNYKLSKDKIKVVYNGIGNDKIADGLNVRKKRENWIKILYAGRLVELKGVHYLINAVSKLRDKYPIKLTIVGDGPERDELKSLVDELDLDDIISFEGFQNDVTPFLANANIFVYPSRSEIFGISIVEAMAFKNICIANNVGGIPEIIQDGHNGFLNYENSLDGLCDKMEQAFRVYNDVGQYERIIKNAQETAKKFSIDETIRGLEKIYSEE